MRASCGHRRFRNCVISSLADFKLFPVLQHIISIAVLAIFIGLLMIEDAGA
jgi:hypothetical protein